MSQKQLKPGLLGRKIGMTQIFTENGDCKGVTVLQVGPCVVTQVKTAAKEGYGAIQMGFEESNFRRFNRARRGHLEKKKLKAFGKLKEFRVLNPESFKLGQTLGATAFEKGDRVDVTGISKGKGFQGVIKRHHKGGGPASHGSHFHRATGSIGQRTWPGRVFKLMKLPGHMGSERITVQNLNVLQVIPEKNYVVVEGAVPGGKNALISIKLQDAALFEKRTAAPEVKEEEAAKE
ncbi:MAG: 50S ribosomal protein L3 [bacterium]|nr:50S ribosomal protein L3 [bacterium]